MGSSILGLKSANFEAPEEAAFLNPRAGGTNQVTEWDCYRSSELECDWSMPHSWEGSAHEKMDPLLVLGRNVQLGLLGRYYAAGKQTGMDSPNPAPRLPQISMFIAQVCLLETLKLRGKGFLEQLLA